MIGTWNPETSIYNGLFQLDDSKSLHRKWWFHQTSVKKWLFRVPYSMYNTKWERNMIHVVKNHIPRDPGSPKLRMEPWKLIRMRFVSVIGHPNSSSSENVTGCLGKGNLVGCWLVWLMLARQINQGSMKYDTNPKACTFHKGNPIIF